MFLFSTIVYFGENPVGYDVYQEEDTFQLKPVIDSKMHMVPPVLTATYSDQLWFIEGTVENEIIEQLKKIIELNKLISSLNVAS